MEKEHLVYSTLDFNKKIKTCILRAPDLCPSTLHVYGQLSELSPLSSR